MLQRIYYIPRVTKVHIFYKREMYVLKLIQWSMFGTDLKSKCIGISQIHNLIMYLYIYIVKPP